MAAKLKDKTDIDHHGPKYILIICHLPDPPTFSLPTTFNMADPAALSGVDGNYVDKEIACYHKLNRD